MCVKSTRGPHYCVWRPPEGQTVVCGIHQRARLLCVVSTRWLRCPSSRWHLEDAYVCVWQEAPHVVHYLVDADVVGRGTRVKHGLRAGRQRRQHRDTQHLLGTATRGHCETHAIDVLARDAPLELFKKRHLCDGLEHPRVHF